MANASNLVVRESITEALLQLMQKKNFTDISITELTQKAGVGRVSFYRNYKSKEEVLLNYMEEIASNHWNSHFKEDPAILWQLTFEIFELLKPIVLQIYKSKIEHVLYQFLKNRTQQNPASSAYEGYLNSMFAGLIFGIYDHWIRTGMKETPEELAKFFYELDLNYTNIPH